MGLFPVFTETLGEDDSWIVSNIMLCFIGTFISLAIYRIRYWVALFFHLGVKWNTGACLHRTSNARVLLELCAGRAYSIDLSFGNTRAIH